MKDPFKSDEPPKPGDRPPKPGDRPPKPGKPPLFKDRRAHRIELRNKIAVFKEEINELKAFETKDEAKQAAVQERLSTLKIRLKECEMEKDAIENFNHTQFVKNVKTSREDEARFAEESQGNTRFFENLTKQTKSETETADSRWDLTKDAEPETETADAFLSTEEVAEAPTPVQGVESSETPSNGNKPEEPETKSPPSQIEIPPNTIV